MTLEAGKRSSYYNVFEMQSTSTEAQTPRQDFSESGTVDIAKKKKTARNRRTSILLGVTALCICIAFVATASVYYFQLRGEWKRESIDFENELKTLKWMNSNKLNLSAVQKVAATSIEDSEQLLSVKTKVHDLRASLNDSSSSNAASIQDLKQAEDNSAAKISQLKSQIDEMMGLWSGDSESLNEAVHNLHIVDTNHSTALLKESDKREQADHLQSQMIEEKFLKHEREHLHDSMKVDQAIDQLKARGSNRSQSLMEKLTELRSQHLNYTRRFSHAIAIVTQSEQKLSADVIELKEFNANDAAKISTLQSRVEDIKSLLNDSKSLHVAVQNLEEFYTNYSRALHKESDERTQADHLQSQMMKARILTHKQEHFKEMRMLNDTIQQLKEMGLNQSESSRKRVTELHRKYLNFSDSVNDDIKEIRQKTGKCLSDLEIEIRSRKSEDMKNSQKLANEVETLNQVDGTLMNYVNALKQNDLNQTDAIQSIEENCVTRNQQQYSSLSDKITINWNAHQTALSKITTQLGDLNQADLDLARQLKVGFTNMETAHNGRFNSLASKVQQLKSADSDRRRALLTASSERERMNSTLGRQIQDGVDDLNRKQTLCRARIDNLEARMNRVSASIEANLMNRDTINALITSVNLLTTGWKRISSTFYYKTFFERVPFNTAVANCQREGGRIATAIWRYPGTVRELIGTRYISSTNFVWMGFTDISREGTWHWSDGITTLPTMIRWRSGEPNNSGNNEDCADGKLEGGVVKMNDRPCSDGVPYICEKDVD